MYKAFYNFRENPFSLSPDSAYLYLTVQHREALSALVYSVSNRPGLTVMLGEAGTGKTTLLNELLGWLEKRRYISSIFTNPTLTREELYDLLLTQLGVECSSSLKSRQLIALRDALMRYRSDGRPAILIIDEAQRLSEELLEEVRLLLNLETPRFKLLEIILSGQPELGQTLGRPTLRQFKQRVSCICKLEALTVDEVRQYVDHRMTQAGLPGQTLFADETITLVHQASGGIPRLINSLCNRTLEIGFAMECRRITTGIVREAAADLDLIPAEPGYIPEVKSGGSPVPEAMGTPASPFAVVRAANRSPRKVQNGPRVPLESYTAREETRGFLASFLDRWR